MQPTQFGQMAVDIPHGQMPGQPAAAVPTVMTLPTWDGFDSTVNREGVLYRTAHPDDHGDYYLVLLLRTFTPPWRARLLETELKGPVAFVLRRLQNEYVTSQEALRQLGVPV